MNIGDAAAYSGLSSKTIRYYESVGLVEPSTRRDNGYREYSEEKLRELVFLRHTRQFGFDLKECKTLLDLYRDPQRRSQDVHEVVADKLHDIEQRINELQTMKTLLEAMSGLCPNDHGAECAIIDALASRPAEVS